eukprot:6177245-Pleurochrysis_carterae.AAC.4
MPVSAVMKGTELRPRIRNDHALDLEMATIGRRNMDSNVSWIEASARTHAYRAPERLRSRARAREGTQTCMMWAEDVGQATRVRVGRRGGSV